MKQTNTDGIKRAAEEVKPEIGLSPTKNAWQTFRRWLGIYTSEEKEVIAYSRRIKAETIAVGRALTNAGFDVPWCNLPGASIDPATGELQDGAAALPRTYSDTTSTISLLGFWLRGIFFRIAHELRQNIRQDLPSCGRSR